MLAALAPIPWRKAVKGAGSAKCKSGDREDAAAQQLALPPTPPTSLPADHPAQHRWSLTTESAG